MTRKIKQPNEQSFYLPAVGQRIVKTTVAVFLCLLVYYLRGFRGREIPTEAAITAIICIQPYVRDTRRYAVNRFAGTLIGSFWGLLFLLLCCASAFVAASLALRLLTLVPSGLLYTVDNGGVLALSFLYAVLLFHEKPQKREIAGIALAVVSIVLISL